MNVTVKLRMTHEHLLAEDIRLVQDEAKPVE